MIITKFEVILHLKREFDFVGYLSTQRYMINFNEACLYSHCQFQYAGYSNINYYLARNHCIGQFELDYGQYDALSGITGYAHGAAMMIRREVIARAGLMAENYFLYYEELDWCEHIRR